MLTIDCLSDGLSGHEMHFGSVLLFKGKLAGKDVAGVWQRMRVPLHCGVRGDRDFENRDLGLAGRVSLIGCAIPRRGALEDSFELDRRRSVLCGSETGKRGSQQCSNDKFHLFSFMSLVGLTRISILAIRSE